MSYADIQYHALLNELVQQAQETNANENRTDVKTYSMFGKQMRFDLSKGFPLLTTKKVHFKSVLTELLWFLKGDTNIKYLLEHNNHIWTDWRYKYFQESFPNFAAWFKQTYNQEAVMLTKAEFENKIVTDTMFAKQWGDIGKGYGHQWRNFGELPELRPYSKDVKYQEGFDQISWVINEIQTNPTSRRLIVSGWNPHEVDQVDLPPCHTLFQFHVSPMSFNDRKRWVDSNYKGDILADYKKEVTNYSFDGMLEHYTNVMNHFKVPTSKLSCQLYQRSADMFLGVPFNIASYALLTQMIAQVCGLGLGEFIWTGGNVHLYENHLEQAKDQLVRNPEWYDCPKLTIDTEGKTIFDITEDDVHLTDYIHFPPIKAPVAV